MFWDQRGGSGWSLDGSCDTGFSLSLAEEAEAGALAGEHVYSFFLNAPIEAATAFLSGSNGSGHGIRQGFKVCNATTNECSEIVTLSDESQPTGEQVTIAGDAIPENATEFVVTGECVDGPCGPSPALGIDDIQVTFVDNTPPEFLGVYGVRHLEGDEVEQIPWDETLWRSGRIEFIPGFIWEPESAMHFYRVSVGPVEYCGPLFNPSIVVPDCDDQKPYIFLPYVDSVDLEDGPATISFTIENLAGLTTTHTVNTLIDSTPPELPDLPSVTPLRNSWSNDRDIRIDWTNTGETVTSETESGIAAVEYDVDPYLGGSFPPNPATDPNPAIVEELNADSLALTLPRNGQWATRFRTIDKAGNTSPWATTTVSVDADVPPAPALASVSTINAQVANVGKVISWTRPSQTISETCGADYGFSTQAGTSPGDNPNTALVAGSATQATVPSSTLLDLPERINYLNVRSYSCAGTPGTIASQAVQVDRTDPVVTPSEGDGSVIDGDQSFTLNATDQKPNTQQSGVASITYEIEGVETTVTGPTAAIEPPLGDFEISFFATDNVGNESDLQTISLTVDRTDPQGAIEPPRADDPALVEAIVSDAESGIGEVALQYRPASGGPWTQVAERFKPAAPQLGQVPVAVRLPYEDEIPDGDYRMRLKLVDGSGRVAYVSKRVGGADAAFASPLRATANLSAGLQTATKPRTPLMKLTVDHGKSAVLSGRLTTADGQGVAGATLAIWREQAGSIRVLHEVVTTDVVGGYRLSIAPGASRTFSVRFGGDKVLRKSEASAKLLTRGQLTLKLSRSKLRSGKVVYFRGRIGAAPNELPARGKEVVIRFISGGRYSDLKLTGKANAAGRFEIAFTPRVRRKAVFRVRAVLPVEPGWAYEAASSSAARLVVKR